jgi:septal ring factor EnvC (AmiA/AmiB activator)
VSLPAALLALVAALAAEAPMPGTGIEQRLGEVRQRRQALERELAGLRRQEQSLLGEVERLELQERLAQARLRELGLELQQNAAQIGETRHRAADLERSIGQTRPLLAARARSLYKLGELSYLRLLLSVDRPADLFRGYRYVTALARRDNQRLAAFRADLTALTTTRAELERRSGEAQALRSELERTRERQDADRKRKTALLTQLVEKKELQAAYLKELEEAEARLTALLQGLDAGEVSVPIGAFKGSLPWPVEGKPRTHFGLRKHPRFDTYTLQNGIEIESAAEAPVAAVHEGTVVFADRFQGYGLMVVVDHGGKHHSVYGHLAEIAAPLGKRVAAGEVLGTAGAALEGPGLYFEMRFRGKPEDPLEWLKRIITP